MVYNGPHDNTDGMSYLKCQPLIATLSSCIFNKKLSYRKESVHLTLLYRGLVVRKLTVSTNFDN